MKKLLALLMALALAASMVACSSDSEGSSDKSTDKPSNNSANVVATAAPETKDETTAPVIEDETTDAGSSDIELTGSVNGYVYENTYIGIGCELEGWDFYSDEKIQEINKQTLNMLGDDYAEALKNATIIYDMFASNNGGVDSVNVNMEKTSINADSYYSLAMPTLRSALEGAGYTNVSITETTISIDGTSFNALDITADVSGTTFYEKAFIVDTGDYIANVTIGSFDQDTVEEVVSKFYLV